MSSCVVCVGGITGEEMLRRGFHLAAGALTPPRVASFCVMPEFHIVPLVGTDSYFFEWVCAGGTFRPSPMRAWGRTQLALWLTSAVRPSLRIDTTHPISTLLFCPLEVARLPGCHTHPSGCVVRGACSVRLAGWWLSRPAPSHCMGCLSLFSRIYSYPTPISMIRPGH